MLVLLSLPSGALGQTSSLRKGIRVEAGFSDNHLERDPSPGLAIRGFVVLGERGLISVEGGALACRLSACDDVLLHRDSPHSEKESVTCCVEPAS
jgi:hypothetical protein